MERFTVRQPNGNTILNCQLCGLDTPEKPCSALVCRNRLQERLAEYEDSGLEPAEVLDMAENIETRTLTWFESRFGIGAGRMMELAEADREKRVKVFPFKPGDHVWVIGILGVCGPEEHVITSVSCHLGEKTDIWFNAELIGYKGEARCSFGPNDIGKNVFRTKEEAETAWKGENHD